ncbi:MAG: tyrosine-type recombinase/integrase [Bacteroidetes bacterium]|nr:tyrosine-type recombinase/integrase [Bacteroidota bacterium]
MFLYKRNGIYYLHYFDESDNRTRRISTRKRKKPEALKFLSNFQKELSTSKRNKYIPLKQFKEEYIRLVGNTLSKSYNRTIDYSFNKLISFLKDNVPLNKITSKDVETFISENFNKHKYGTALTYRTLKSAFNKAIDWNYISLNPFVKVKLPKIPKKYPVFINETELKSIIYSEANKDMKDFYLLAFHSGMRVGEVINLEWNAVDLTLREITVKNTDTFTTKSKKERTIPINETLYSMLIKRVPKVFSIHKSRYVFEKHEGVRYNTFYVSKKFKKTVLNTKTIDPSIHAHSLRHSFASNLVSRGVSLYVVKELLGHKSVATSQIYSHLDIESLKEAVKVLEA